MKLFNNAWLVLVACVVFSAGCSRTEKMLVTQESQSLTIPYDSLGWIQVNMKAPSVQYKRIAGQLGEWVTFGYIDNPSQEEYLKKILDNKIRKAAQKGYKADEVISMTYWPALSSKAFPDGRMGARGEMIRYKRFSA